MYKKGAFSNNYWVLLLALLFPLLFLGVWDRHDWGDDFAQYLLQAKNVVDGRAQIDNGLVFPADSEKFAVTAYPVGFPLLLVPVYYLFGTSVKPYFILLSLTLIVSGLLLFRYYRRDFSWITALMMSLWFCYNPFVIEWKWQILSDIPFLMLVYFSLIFFPAKKSEWKWLVIGGIICGFIASVRIIGWALPLAISASMVFSKQQVDKENDASTFLSILLPLFIFIGSTVMFFLFLNVILFNIPIREFAGFYSSAVQQHAPAFLINLDFYRQMASFCFPLPFGLEPLSWWWILSALVCWFIKFIRERKLSEWFFLIYGIVLLFYPYQNGGLRFLIPILPLLIGYTISSLHFVLTKISIKFSETLLPLIVAFLFLGNKDFITQISQRKNDVIQGPQDAGSERMIQFVRDSLPLKSVMVFCKPRALALYTNHPVTSFYRNATNEKSEERFQETHVSYLIYPKVSSDNEIYSGDMEAYLNEYEKKYSIVWESNDYRIYKRR